MEQRWQAADYSAVFLRLALASSFLSSLADRFGLWGNFGQPYVTWGEFSRFLAYTAQLTSIVPASFAPALAWAATTTEIVLALALVVGLFTRTAAFLSGALLLLFGLAMTFALGIKAPLNTSVFTASAGAFLLSNYGRYKLSLDGLTRPRAAQEMFRAREESSSSPTGRRAANF